MADSSSTSTDKSTHSAGEAHKLGGQRGEEEEDDAKEAGGKPQAHDSDTETDLALHVPNSAVSSDASPQLQLQQQQQAAQNGQYHHRRKRIRISPLARVSGDSRPGPCADSAATTGSAPGRYVTVSADADSGSHHTPQPMDSSETNHPLSGLIASTIDAELQSIILKYVRLPSVIRCLELAGFCSPFVLACLDEAQIQRVEDFVGHTCSLIDSIAVREQFLGPIFAKYPEQFRLPAGTVCGLLLASADIKRRYHHRRIPTAHVLAPNCSTLEVHHTEMDFLHEHGFSDMASQTEVSVLPDGSKSEKSLTESDTPAVTPVTSASPMLPTSIPSVSNALSIALPTVVTSYMDAANTTKLNPLITSIEQSATPNTVAMMAAAFQAAAVAASGSGYTQALSKSNALLAPSSPASQPPPHPPAPPPHPFISSSPLTHSHSHGMATALNGAAFPTDPSTVITTVQNAARLVAAVSGCSIQNSLHSLTSVVGSNNNNNNSTGNTIQGLMYDEEVIDLERLKQHSSASAIRLASRQFVNAHLVRGRDFDMEMEISVTPEGLKRVTGIFYCHLCREKRERTSAVRFSIARNRYPVLSNVLSHLKTHFQYRGQLFHMQPSAPLMPQLKSSCCLNDSLLSLPPSAGNGLATVSSNPLGALGLNLTSNSYADVGHTSTDLVGGARLFMNPCPGVPQSELVIKGEESLDTGPDPRMTDDHGTNSSGSDTRASLGSERSSPPARVTADRLLHESAADTGPGSAANCPELLAENGLSLDLFSTQPGNGSGPGSGGGGGVMLPR